MMQQATTAGNGGQEAEEELKGGRLYDHTLMTSYDEVSGLASAAGCVGEEAEEKLMGEGRQTYAITCCN